MGVAGMDVRVTLLCGVVRVVRFGAWWHLAYPVPLWSHAAGSGMVMCASSSLTEIPCRLAALYVLMPPDAY